MVNHILISGTKSSPGLNGPGGVLLWLSRIMHIHATSTEVLNMLKGHYMGAGKSGNWMQFRAVELGRLRIILCLLTFQCV